MSRIEGIIQTLDELIPGGSKRNFYRRVKRLSEESNLSSEFEMSRNYTSATLTDFFKNLTYPFIVGIAGSIVCIKYDIDLLETITKFFNF